MFMFISHVYDFLPNRTDQEIQTYTIAVINALFLKAPDDKRQVSCWGLYPYICRKHAIFIHVVVPVTTVSGVIAFILVELPPSFTSIRKG